EINSPELARAVNNLASIHYALGDLRECLELELRSIGVAERFGLGSMLQFSRANVLGSYLQLGRWDELLSVSEALLADAPPAGVEAAVRTFRAWVRVARGDIAGAKADSDWALDVARRAEDPQALYPSLSAHAYVLLAAGAHADARAVLLELMEGLEQRKRGALF